MRLFKATRSTGRVKLRLLSGLLLSGLFAEVSALDTDLGVIGPAPQSFHVDVPGAGIFLDTINFDVQEPDTLLTVTSRTSQVDFFSMPLFRNSDDTQIAQDVNGTYVEYQLQAGQGGYHLHGQGIAQAVGASYTLELFSSATLAAVVVNGFTGQTTTEAGGSLEFAVSLSAEPVEEVSIPVASSNIAEAIVVPDQLVFAAGDTGPLLVTVNGVDDAIQDGNTSFDVLLGPANSTDLRYSGLDVADPTLLNLDDEAGFQVSLISGPTSESGDTATFSVSLSSEPIADVSISLMSSNPAEGFVEPAGLTFQPGTATNPQTVTVTGVNDSVADGPVDYLIEFGLAASTDPIFNGLKPASVPVTNEDDDIAAIVVSPQEGIVTGEDGQTDSITIVLSTLPVADVSIAVTSGNPDEASVDPKSLLFTPMNATTPRKVTVIGVDDTENDGDATYTVVFGAAQSADDAYDGLRVAPVDATNLDNDNSDASDRAHHKTGGCTLATRSQSASMHFDWPLLLLLLVYLYFYRCKTRRTG